MNRELVLYQLALDRAIKAASGRIIELIIIVRVMRFYLMTDNQKYLMGAF